MSVSGISSSSFCDYNTQGVESKMQQIQQVFQQLGQDLQSGNLSAAQADFATLQKLQPQTNSSSSSQSNNPIAKAFNQLSQDLQSGNLSAAQKDYATIQQDFQNQAAQWQNQPIQGHHHHHHGDDGSDSSSGASAISQLLDQLGQALQSGNLSSAQQTFATLQQDFQQFAQDNGLQTQASTPSGSNSVSVTA